jgi:hypothetical protein
MIAYTNGWICCQLLENSRLSPLLLRAFNYWHSKVPKSGIPSRQDIDLVRGE